MENIQKETPNIWYFFFEWDLNSSDDFIIRYLTIGILKISGWNKQKKFIDRETKLEREREREYWPIFFCRGQLGRNRGEGWKWNNKKFI